MKTFAWVMPTSDGKGTWVCDYDVPALEAREKGYLVHDLVLREDAERAIAEAVAHERAHMKVSPYTYEFRYQFGNVINAKD